MFENENKDLQLEGTQIEETPIGEETTSNIFDDFVEDTTLVDEVKKLKEEENKDIYYYLIIIGKIFRYIFIILIIVSVLLFAYVYVQKDKAFSNSKLLDLICFITKDSSVKIPNGTTYCSSISYTKDYYDNELKTLKDKQLGLITTNLVAFYEKDNLLKSKEVAFLLDKSANRLQVTEVLNRFDKLKYNFTRLKERIQCRNMNIDSVTRILTLSCDTYSAGYETNSMPGFAGKKIDCDSGDVGALTEGECISGTSLSITNSFLNYIEKNNADFTLIDRQKMFTIDKVSTDGFIDFTDKTTFTLKLKINF